MQRVSVVGTSGSGKSTLARAIAEVLDAPHIELDSIYHQPGWKPLPREQFVARVAEVAAGERWVVCGNYKSVRDVLWTAADTVVWLDLPRGVTARRIISRSLRRAWTREELWNGNRERWLNLFLPVPKHNVVLWSLLSFSEIRRRYAAAMEDPRWSRIEFVRLRSPAEVTAWLDELRAQAAPVTDSASHSEPSPVGRANAQVRHGAMCGTNGSSHTPCSHRARSSLCSSSPRRRARRPHSWASRSSTTTSTSSTS